MGLTIPLFTLFALVCFLAGAFLYVILVGSIWIEDLFKDWWRRFVAFFKSRKQEEKTDD